MVERENVVGWACAVEERVLARDWERFVANIDGVAKNRAECACGEERDESERELHVCVVMKEILEDCGAVLEMC